MINYCCQERYLGQWIESSVSLQQSKNIAVSVYIKGIAIGYRENLARLSLENLNIPKDLVELLVKAYKVISSCNTYKQCDIVGEYLRLLTHNKYLSNRVSLGFLVDELEDRRQCCIMSATLEEEEYKL